MKQLRNCPRNLPPHYCNGAGEPLATREAKKTKSEDDGVTTLFLLWHILLRLQLNLKEKEDSLESGKTQTLVK